LQKKLGKRRRERSPKFALCSPKEAKAIKRKKLTKAIIVRQVAVVGEPLRKCAYIAAKGGSIRGRPPERFFAFPARVKL